MTSREELEAMREEAYDHDDLDAVEEEEEEEEDIDDEEDEDEDEDEEGAETRKIPPDCRLFFVASAAGSRISCPTPGTSAGS